MAGKLTIQALRRQAVLGSLLPPTTLARAIGAAGFVQADPIRAPARAQDLILRHRVAGYRAGDLERRFARLGLEEDFLYAYGFMPRDTVRLLHPRDPGSSGRWQVPGELAAEVLAFVRDRGPTHPADLEQRFGRERAVNGWGGFSKATTRALQSLHYHGLLRVAGRRDGIRVYEAAVPHPEPLLPEARSREIALLVIGILAPLAEAGLAGHVRPARPWRARAGRVAADGGGAAGSGRTRERRGGRRALSLAGRRGRAARRAGCGAAAGAVRSDRVGAAAVRASVGVGLSVRGLHQAGAAPVRLLRDAAAVGLRRHRLGQCQPRRADGWTPNSALSARGRGMPAFRRGLDAELAAMNGFLSKG